MVSRRHVSLIVAALMLSGDESADGAICMSEYGYRTHAGDVQVLIPIDRRVQSVGFIVTVERTIRLPLSRRFATDCA
ncbi:unnamed protein product, partial [Mesorhabditis spiculigera]